MTRFNTTLVQLKGAPRPPLRSVACRFNTTLVQLKANWFVQDEDGNFSFNTTLVQLKGSNNLDDISPNKVSIPHWFN